jgi:hypothetical protein
MIPRTIITYLADWNPTWIKTVEFSNRLIKWISIPRKDFKESLNRDEIKYSWIYMLLGVDENDNEQAYIWQATVLWKRLNDHYKDTKKDFWNNAICFTYKDWSLTESDINFLERELINEAKRVNRYNIINWTSWNNWLIQEHRIPDMQEFMEDLKILILNLWYPILKEVITKKELEDEKNVYYLNARWSNAKWFYTEEWFLVLKGSIWKSAIIPYQIKQWHIKRNRDKLIGNWDLIEDQENINLINDILFKTPTNACNIISWWNLNWWIEWKDKNWNTLDKNIRK